MPWIVHNNRQLWVGFHEVMGVVVYDSTLQERLGEDRVRLFLVSELRVAKFQSSIVRDWIVSSSETAKQHDSRKQLDNEQIRHAASKYLEFEATEEERRQLAKRHVAYLKQKGLPKAGMRQATGGHRETHCYCHRAWLDNHLTWNVNAAVVLSAMFTVAVSVDELLYPPRNCNLQVTLETKGP